MRLDLDNHRIIEDQLSVRDGLHMIKVYQRLPLEPCLLAAITVADLDPAGEVEVWTLRTFVETTQ